MVTLTKVPAQLDYLTDSLMTRASTSRTGVSLSFPQTILTSVAKHDEAFV